MADVPMESREFHYILSELGLSLTGFSELVGYDSNTISMYSRGKGKIPSRVCQLLRMLLQHRDDDYIERLRIAAQPLSVPEDAPLWVFGRGRHGHAAHPDTATTPKSETPLQHELRYIFAQLKLSQSDVAKALSLTKPAVSSWFIVNANGPTGLVLRVLRVAVTTPILKLLLNAPIAVVPETFDDRPPTMQRGRPKGNIVNGTTHTDEPMTPREFHYILDRLQLTPAEFNSQSGYVRQYYLLAALKRPTVSFPRILVRLLRLSFKEPHYFKQLAEIKRPVGQPLSGAEARAELRQIFAVIGIDRDLLAEQLGLNVHTITNWLAAAGGSPNRFTLRMLHLAAQTDMMARLSEPDWQRAVVVPPSFLVSSERSSFVPPTRTPQLLRPELDLILARLQMTIPQLCQLIDYEKYWRLERQVNTGTLPPILARLLRAAYAHPDLLGKLAAATPRLPSETKQIACGSMEA